MASDDDPMPPLPYWPPLIIDGELIDRSHLEPMSLAYACPQFTRPLTAHVVFSSHCFSGHFRAGQDDPTWKIMDGDYERVFCPKRYSLSHRLRAMVEALPQANVWQTKSDRNFVYATTLDNGLGGHYPMFFSVKKDQAGRGDIAVRVESAYPVTSDEMKEQLREAPKVKFATLSAKVVQNASLNFRKR